VGSQSSTRCVLIAFNDPKHGYDGLSRSREIPHLCATADERPAIVPAQSIWYLARVAGDVAKCTSVVGAESKGASESLDFM
jgi:hypothetical protein